MTTSINRQLSLLVQGYFKKYAIDNFQLEVDLVSALQRMWTEGGRDPAKLSSLREEMLSALLKGGAEDNELALMEGRVKNCMRLNLDGRDRYNGMLKFLVKMEKENGQTVEQFARWCEEHPYDAPKFFKFAEKPDLLAINWPAAFAEIAEHKVVAETDDNGIPMSY
jgi:hypothetical protein